MARFVVGVLAVLIGLAAGCAHMDVDPSIPRSFDGMPLLVVEEFDEPAPEEWEPTDPKAWAFTTDGERSVYGMIHKSSYGPPVRSPRGISLLKDVVVSDFVMDTWVRSTTKEYGHRDMCFFFGHQDPTHFYYVHLGTQSDASSNTIHIVNGKPRTPIVETRNDGTDWTEGYHHVRVVRNVEDGTIEAYFDDMTEPCMTATDKTFKSGRVGVGSFDDTGYVDRFILWGKKVDQTMEKAERKGGRY